MRVLLVPRLSEVEDFIDAVESFVEESLDGDINARDWYAAEVSVLATQVFHQYPQALMLWGILKNAAHGDIDEERMAEVEAIMKELDECDEEDDE